MEKHQIEIKSLKEGGFVLIDDAPCRVVSVDISRPGKHGAAKARLVAMGIFDNSKRIIVKPADSRVDVPVVEKKSAQVIARIGANVQLMDMEDYSIREVPAPAELELKEGDEILVWKFGEHIMIKGKK